MHTYIHTYIFVHTQIMCLSHNVSNYSPAYLHTAYFSTCIIQYLHICSSIGLCIALLVYFSTFIPAYLYEPWSVWLLMSFTPPPPPPTPPPTLPPPPPPLSSSSSSSTYIITIIVDIIIIITRLSLFLFLLFSSCWSYLQWATSSLFFSSEWSL